VFQARRLATGGLFSCLGLDSRELGPALFPADFQQIFRKRRDDNSGFGGGFVQPEGLILPTLSDSRTDCAECDEHEESEPDPRHAQQMRLDFQFFGGFDTIRDQF